MKHPQIRCLVPSGGGYVAADDPVCQVPLRVARTKTRQSSEPTINYGQYFRGISEVISRDGFREFTGAVAGRLGAEVSPGQVEEISICPEKHGSDYHPARVQVMLRDGTCAAFVMNVAVTERGRALLCSEFQLLQHLHKKYNFPFLPRTYFQGEVLLPPMVMFLGDWFEGYHEFHLAVDPEDGSQRLVIWDPEGGCRPLAPAETRRIYRAAAKILTLYYDVQTFEQIFPWHHAAGDFVVKEQEDSVKLRLVTARQYTPMMEPDQGVSPFEALLFFLLNLSLRMRLDRLDGVGAVAWADDHSVDPTLEGFWEGLKRKERCGHAAAGWIKGFTDYLDGLSEEDLSERFHALVDAYDPSAPDMPVIREHLEPHTSKFCSSLHSSLLNKKGR